MSVEKSLAYRGDVKAILGVGGVLYLVSAHPEGKPTGLYRLNADAWTLEEGAALPRGGVALAFADEAVWVAGEDGQVYRFPASGGEARALGVAFASAPSALAAVSGDRLAVLAGSEVAVLARGDGRVLQALGLPEAGTCLAVDPTGRWLVAGTAKGTVAVFEAEEQPEFLPGDSGMLHEGEVTALAFESEELRFLSAGADLKLLSTLARGRLEPEDRGRGANHADRVAALAWGPGERFYSGSRDGTIKAWPKLGAGRPATFKDGVGRVVALALVDVLGRPSLVAACDDNTLRAFPIDASGKLGDISRRALDAYAGARDELAQDESPRREAALTFLAVLDDAKAIELIAEQAGKDPDHALRLLSARALGASRHPRAATLLEPLLKHPDEAVRLAALAGLRAHLGADDLRPLELALKAQKADVGRAAVEALEALAGRDDRALARLLEALNAATPEVRQAALASLEAVHGADSPESGLVALEARFPDVRRQALVRLFRRGLLQAPGVQAALRRRSEEEDPEVRRIAFLLAVSSRPALLESLRRRDLELRRELDELEAGPSADAEPEKKAKPSKAKKKETGPAPGPDLEGADYEPLLRATASRALDTSLRGARGLAMLGDGRAFGLLLQLSREADAGARVEVCRALAALDDPRAIKRLRSLLHDDAPQVRDAAFSALVQIHQDDPLLGAESGLNAGFEDVRRRGLQVLIAEVRKAPPKGSEGPAWRLLARALNDDFATVRTEAFKAALNLQLAGGGAGTLRFVRRSIHADVRREALTEVMAQEDRPWAWDLLLEFYDDPDPTLRGDAFAFANKKTKGLEFLEAGLGSRYADIRGRAVEALVKKHTPAAQSLLVRALDDEARGVRLAALESLVVADALPELTAALGNPHADVRLRAARALARHGDAAALAPLLALAGDPEPREPERRKEWAEIAASALEGLGELGDPAALSAIIPLLDSPHAAIRKEAARALAWVVRPETLDALRQALPHSDPQVKYHAALGLAFAGDASVASLVYSAKGAEVLDAGARLAAALTLGAAGEDQLVVALDDGDESVRARALLLLSILELKSPRGDAARCLGCLSSRMPRVRLAAARALESLADPSASFAFVVGLVNDRGDKPGWTVAEATVDALAELLAYGSPLTRARTALLLRLLGEEEQAPWDLAWSRHEARFAEEIAALRESSKGRPRVPLQSTAEQLRGLAFGAYVGLVREQGGLAKGRGAGNDPAVLRVRQAALGRVSSLAQDDPHAASSARPVFVQALGDPNQPVRLQAFEHLQALGMDASALGAEALASGYTDLGVKGIELLSASAPGAEGVAVFERVMLARNDALATEAAKLLQPRLGVVAVAARALSATFDPLREQAVLWLAAEYDRDPEARDLLRKALGSRYARVREVAALELAGKKDPAAFEALAALLAAAGLPVPQRRVIGALVSLGDLRTPDVLLDRLEADPAGTALADDLIRAAGDFRRPESSGRFLALLAGERKRRDAVARALLVVSGHDQPIEDPDDSRSDRSWEAKQFPRHDAVLALLMERLTALGETRPLVGLTTSQARWARGKEVEPVLAALAASPDDSVRRAAVESLAWRLRKRGASAFPLVKALEHRDPFTQIAAAEGLARAGRDDGLNVLLASLDYVSDLDLRRRAVRALGELAEERSLDSLLRLARDDTHALQDEALEAVGHFRRSPKADEIFGLLERVAKGEGSSALAALKGLRWLDRDPGWQLIRRRATDPTFDRQAEVVALLGHHDDPATRDALLRLLATAGIAGRVLAEALEAARRLWGDESLEPDYALLRNGQLGGNAARWDVFLGSLRRVCERGEPRRIFEVLEARPGPDPTGRDPVLSPLVVSLLRRTDLPLAEALDALRGTEARVVRVAARVLGRAGHEAGGSSEAIETALRAWRDAWEQERRKRDRGGGDEARLTGELTPCLRSLVWASGRLGAGRDILAALAAAYPGDPLFRPIRLEVVTALGTAELTTEVVEALEAATSGDDPEIRSLASATLGRRRPEASAALAGRLLSDRNSFRRLAEQDGVGLGAVARDAARQVHAQGVVVPYLVERGDVEALGTVAADRALPEATRLGAIEGLAALGIEDAEERLRAIGLASDDVEELRKAAWRGLRRSSRARRAARAEVTP